MTLSVENELISNGASRGHIGKKLQCRYLPKWVSDANFSTGTQCDITIKGFILEDINFSPTNILSVFFFPFFRVSLWH